MARQLRLAGWREGSGGGEGLAVGPEGQVGQAKGEEKGSSE